MDELPRWIEGSAVATTLSTSAWAYPLVNVVHILGVALLFGAIAVLDLRLLGLWSTLPVTVLARPAVSIAASGFGIAAISGAALFTVEATDYVRNPLFAVKLAAIALAVINLLLLHRSPAWRWRATVTSPAKRLAFAGGASLGCWLIAIASGRLIAYW